MTNDTAALFDAPVEPDVDNRTVEELVQEYLALRDELDLRRGEWKTFEEDMKSSMSALSMKMRERADAAGVDSFTIRNVGTAFRATKTSYRTADWSTFIDWVKATDNFQCLEKRPAKLAVAEVHRQTGSIPDGLDIVVEQEFQVRKLKPGATS